MKQALNRVKIEGILSENNLELSTYTDKKNNDAKKECIRGNIVVRVHQVINGETQVLDIPVHCFQAKYKKNGEPNPAYESLTRVLDFTSIAACGGDEDKADKIRITGASLAMNEFPNQMGNIVSYPRVSGSFVSKVTGEFKPEASFSLEFMVNGINPVLDKDGAEVDPPKYCIDVIVPQYGGKVDVMKLYATTPGVIDGITNHWEVGNSYSANGRLHFTSKTEEIVEEQDFGDPITRTRTTNLSELVVTGGTETPLEDDVFPADEIKAAIEERKARLETMKAQPKKAPSAPSTAKGPIDLGF